MGAKLPALLHGRRFLCRRYEYIQREDVPLCVQLHRPAVLFDEQLHALHAIAVAKAVRLRGLRQAILKGEPTGKEVLLVDEQHAAIQCGDRQADEPLVGRCQLFDGIDGVVEHVAKQGIDVVVLHKGEGAAVGHVRKGDVLRQAEPAFAGQHGIERGIPCVADGVIVLHGLIERIDLLARHEGGQDRKLMFQIVRLEVEKVDSALVAPVLYALVALHFADNGQS